MCRNSEIQLQDLPATIAEGNNVHSGITLVKESEKDVILEALQRNKGNKSKTAVELGVHRSTLWRKIRSYRIGA
jgi:transcriptional regulator of acetoin/glycerol metabolism